MKFILAYQDGTVQERSDFIAFEIDKSMSAPCHSLSAVFPWRSCSADICSVTAFNNGRRIFYGGVDSVNYAFNPERTITVRARSNAKKLLDSQCMPRSYNMPSIEDIFFHYARPLGFKSRLPQRVCNQQVNVSKTTSCWGILHTFVKAVCGGEIYVDTDDNIRIYDGNQKKHIFSNTVSGAVPFTTGSIQIKRSGIINEIRYKIHNGDTYKYVCRLKNFYSQGVGASRYMNLSNVPEWKRDSVLTAAFEGSVKDYFTLKVNIPFGCEPELNDNVDFNDGEIGRFNDLYVREMRYSFSGVGENCMVVLARRFDLKEEKYVDE